MIPPRTPAILVVDDQAVNRAFLSGILRKEGYGVLEADDGPSARAEARERPPDLILLDVMMPEESGFETCTRLKGDPLTTDIPVIFISAADDAETKIRGLSLGAVDYVTRPFHRDEVLARVRIHLRLAGADRDRAALQAERIAAEIAQAQSAILTPPEAYPEARFAVARATAREAGGDFYEVFPLGTGIFGYFVADVSGHGLDVSYTTPMLKALIAQNASPMFTTRELLRTMNTVLLRLMRDGRHITACLVRVNRATLRAEAVCAGHPFPVLLPAEGPPRLLGSPGTPLGAFEHVALDTVTTELATGDRLFLYTDGLLESGSGGLRPRSEGQRILLEALPRHRELPLGRAASLVFRHMVGEGAPLDDATLLALEV